eukprot:gene10108-18768_t
MGVKPDMHGVLNIGVSFDGTWKNRGHSSHNGAGAVIDLLTGLPIGSETLTKYMEMNILLKKKNLGVNHVAKRMGTALNNIVAEARSQGSSVSGKGNGKKMVQIGVNMAMSQFAMDSTTQETLCPTLGLLPGTDFMKNVITKETRKEL